MTVSSLTNRKNQVSDNVQLIFAYDFLILDETHLKLYLDGDETTPLSGFTVTGVGNQAGGTAVFTVAPAAGTLSLVREVPLTQSFDYITGGRFPADTHERLADLLVMMAQKLEDESGRSVKLPVSSTLNSSLLLPEPDAFKYLRWAAGETSLENVVLESLGTIALQNVGYVVKTKAEADALLLTLTSADAGRKVFITSEPDGGAFTVRYDAALGTYVSNGNAANGTVIGNADGTIGLERNYSGAVNIKWFGAKVDNIIDDYTAIKTAHDVLVANGGGVLLFDGMAYCNTGIELAANDAGANLGVTWRGTGWNSGIRADSDIEQVYYGDVTTTTLGISRFFMENMKLERDTATVYAKMNARFTVASDVHLKNVFVLNNESVTTNIGGVHFAKSAGTAYPGSVNVMENTRIQGGGLFMECRDSRVDTCWVWGQRTAFGIKSQGSGNSFIETTAIGGWNFNSSAIGNRMNGCTVDGVTDTDVGRGGVYANQAHGLQIDDCDLYTIKQGHAIHFVDMLRAVVTVNTFKDNNLVDNSYDDVRIESVTFASNGNIFKDNTHTCAARTNKGYCYNEVNGGAVPGPQKITGNSIQAGTGYQVNGINRLNASTEVRGNTGHNTEARRKGQVTVPAGTNPTISIVHTSPYDPLISDVKVMPSNNAEGLGITSWYISRSSATVVTLFARGTVTAGATFEWEVDTL